MLELKLTGNCLMGSRPLLSFDVGFDTPHFRVIKELLVQIFGIPNYHPKSQPFHDHVISFSLLDNKIWVRNYEVLAMDGKLAEIGKYLWVLGLFFQSIGCCLRIYPLIRALIY